MTEKGKQAQNAIAANKPKFSVALNNKGLFLVQATSPTKSARGLCHSLMNIHDARLAGQPWF